MERHIDNPLFSGETPLQTLFVASATSSSMSPHPMSGPDPLTPLPTASGVVRAQPDDASFESDFADLAARFAALSGGGLSPELSADLALEIVLNEIVEQACLATGATGAAVVLPRDGDMVCRAASGLTAPELGARLDTDSGLSGECIKTRRTQRCQDVLTDPRADVEASGRLGVRSVIVMPLLRGTELLGIFELLSSEAYAFGDRDEGSLEALAARVLSNLERASQVLAPQRQSLPVAEPIPETVPEASHGFWGGFGVATWAMAVAVLVCAVLLGVQVTRHMGGQRARVRRQRVATPAHAFAGQAPSVEEHASGKTVTTSAPRPAAVKPSSVTAVPPGGLRIYENGKEVFRLPPAENQTGDAAEAGMLPASSLEPEKVMELSPATAEGSLLRRVEPEYPEQARQQRVQGPVVLEVHIGADGTVQDVQVVSGPAQLAAASADAVKQWRFKPRSIDGRPVEMQTTVTLNFRLPE